MIQHHHVISAGTPNPPQTERQQLLGSSTREHILKPSSIPITSCETMTTTTNSSNDDNMLSSGKNLTASSISTSPTTVVLRTSCSNSSSNTTTIPILTEMPANLMDDLFDESQTIKRQSAPPQTLKIAFSPSLPQLSSTSSGMELASQIRQRQQLLLKRRDFCNQFFDAVKPTKVETPDVEQEKVGPTRILDFMFLGSLEDALNAQFLEKCNIKKIINISENGACPAGLQNDAEHFFRIPVIDSNKAKLIPYFEDAYKFIELARKSGENVLLHCMAGISRSPTLAIAYIMRNKKIGCEEAKEFVKRLRPSISPNMNFMGQLMVYESALRANHLLPPLMRHSYTCTGSISSIEENSSENKIEFDEDLPELTLSTNKKKTKATIVDSIKLEPQEDTTQRRRPTCFVGISARNFALNKSDNESTTANTSTDLTPVYVSSAMSSFPFVNENRKRTINTPLALPERPRQLFETTSLPSTSSLSESQLPISTCCGDSLTKTQCKSSLSLPLKTVEEEVLSPSTEFSKLDISVMNPCFDINNKPCAKSSRRTSVSTTTSSGVFSEDSEDGRQCDIMDAVELPPCTSSLYPISSLETPTIENPMFENPMFNITNDAAPKLPIKAEVVNEKLNAPTSSAKQNRNALEAKTHSAEKPQAKTVPLLNAKKDPVETRRHICVFPSCKSIVRNMVRKSSFQSSESYHANKLSSNNTAKSRFFCCSDQQQSNCCCVVLDEQKNTTKKNFLFGQSGHQFCATHALSSLTKKSTRFDTLPTVLDTDDFEQQENSLTDNLKNLKDPLLLNKTEINKEQAKDRKSETFCFTNNKTLLTTSTTTNSTSNKQIHFRESSMSTTSSINSTFTGTTLDESSCDKTTTTKKTKTTTKFANNFEQSNVRSNEHMNSSLNRTSLYPNLFSDE